MTRTLVGIQLRQYLFVLGNLIACAVFVSAFVLPIGGFFSDRDDRIADRGRVLARLKGIADQEASIRSVASDSKAELQSGEFLAGANENVISADLQTRVKALTEGAGTRSRAVQAIPVKASDHVRYIGSRIEIVGSIQAIHRAVYAVESARPYLFITAATLRNTQATSKLGQAEEPTIVAQLDVYGAIQIVGRDK
jgi:hypothetical protein